MSLLSGTVNRGADKVFIPGFSANKPHFSAKSRIFLQIHRNTLEISNVHPIIRLARRTDSYPILETFQFYSLYGDLAALELREAAKKHLTTFFCKLKKSCVSGGRLWNQPNFSANLCFWRKIMDAIRTEIFCKIRENGVAITSKPVTFWVM